MIFFDLFVMLTIDFLREIRPFHFGLNVWIFFPPEFDLEALKSSHHHVGCTLPHVATW